MPTNDERAERAIEEYLGDHRREELEQVWREHKPATDWDMDAEAWRGVGARIVVNFNETDPDGVQLDPDANETGNAIRNLHDEPLGAFEQYLINEANRALGPRS